MKGKLLTVFFSLAILVGLSTSAFSQAIKVDFTDPLMDPVTTNEVSHGAAVLLIEASQDTLTNGIQAPDINNAYYLSNGDTLVQQNDMYYNPIQYYNYVEAGWGSISVPQSQRIVLDGTHYIEEQEYSFYLRIFNNLKGEGPAGWGLPDSSFDSTGNMVDGSANLAETYYFDTAILTVTIPVGGIGDDFLFTIPMADQNWIPIINTEPVPEPGAMFLMAAGLLWFGRKLKRK